MAKSLVLYGDSGTFKTTALSHAAKYLYHKHKKPVRLVTAEESTPLIPYVEAGIIQIIRLDQTIANPLSHLSKLSKGWWPSDKGQLMPPQGPLTAALAGVSAYFVEGLTSIAELVMRDCRNKARKISQDPIGTFVEDGEKFCAPAMSHYGFVQAVMLDRIVDFSALPVDRVIFTAHESKGEEEGSKNPIRGAGLVGMKGTDKIPKQVGSYIHAEYYNEELTTTAKNKDQITVYRPKVRYFFTSHPDQKFSQVTYPAKTRIPSASLPELLEKWPGGYFEPTLTEGLNLYLELEDRLTSGTVEELVEWKAAQDSEPPPPPCRD